MVLLFSISSEKACVMQAFFVWYIQIHYICLMKFLKTLLMMLLTFAVTLTVSAWHGGKIDKPKYGTEIIAGQPEQVTISAFELEANSYRWQEMESIPVIQVKQFNYTDYEFNKDLVYTPDILEFTNIKYSTPINSRIKPVTKYHCRWLCNREKLC